MAVIELADKKVSTDTFQATISSSLTHTLSLSLYPFLHRRPVIPTKYCKFRSLWWASKILVNYLHLAELQKQ